MHMLGVGANHFQQCRINTKIIKYTCLHNCILIKEHAGEPKPILHDVDVCQQSKNQMESNLQQHCACCPEGKIHG